MINRLTQRDWLHHLLLTLPVGRPGSWLWRLRERSHSARLQHRGPGGYLADTRIAFPRNVRIGDGVTCGGRVLIDGTAGVSIGSRTMIAYGAIITSASHDPDREPMHDTLIAREVRIGEDCWIGAGAIILPGVSIADGVVVAAGAVVTRSIEQPRVIVAGVPARLLRHRRIANHHLQPSAAAAA